MATLSVLICIVSFLQFSHVVLAQWTSQNIRLDSQSCRGHEIYLQTTFTTIQAMLKNTIDVLPLLSDNLGKYLEDISPTDLARQELFMVMYGGIRDQQDEGLIQEARVRINIINHYATTLYDALSNDGLHLDIFCNDDHIYKDGEALNSRGQPKKDSEGRQLYIYKSHRVPSLVPIMDFGKCADHPDGLFATISPTVENKDVLTICSYSWEHWKGYLNEYKTKDIHDMEGEDIDIILNESAEVTILHELTHANSLFHNDVMKDHVPQDSTSAAYEWLGCWDLASNPDTRTLALYNAETFSYFNAGLYLSQCNWRDGKCQDPVALYDAI